VASQLQTAVDTHTVLQRCKYTYFLSSQSDLPTLSSKQGFRQDSPISQQALISVHAFAGTLLPFHVTGTPPLKLLTYLTP
jgi:hypothetical protein